jgi:hypothetical protein
MKQEDVGEPLEEVPGDVALERAHCFAIVFPSLIRRSRYARVSGLVLGADERDRVDRVRP